MCVCPQPHSTIVLLRYKQLVCARGRGWQSGHLAWQHQVLGSQPFPSVPYGAAILPGRCGLGRGRLDRGIGGGRVLQGSSMVAMCTTQSPMPCHTHRGQITLECVFTL